jgi:hypothetical protein
MTAPGAPSARMCCHELMICGPSSVYILSYMVPAHASAESEALFDRVADSFRLARA